MNTKQEVRDMGSVELALHAILTPANDSDELVTVSVGPGGEAIALWSGAAGAQAVTYGPSPEYGVVIPDLEIAFPLVQPLPGGRTLIVGARCHWNPDGPERNAIVVDADGSRVAAGTLGDGIEHVLTTPSGLIWVGYFDEGVLGNYGWGGPGPAPIGSPGIVRFTADLQVDWRYPRNADGGWLVDTYALNVDGESAWSSYYTDFPVVRIASDDVTTWCAGVRGVRALIMSGDRCALIGGYGPDSKRVLLGSLTPEGFVAEASGELALPGGAELGQCRLVARGDELHVFAENRWYKTTITSK
jgi:hypothetical protein